MGGERREGSSKEAKEIKYIVYDGKVNMGRQEGEREKV